MHPDDPQLEHGLLGGLEKDPVTRGLSRRKRKDVEPRGSIVIPATKMLLRGEIRKGGSSCFGDFWSDMEGNNQASTGSGEGSGGRKRLI